MSVAHSSRVMPILASSKRVLSHSSTITALSPSTICRQCMARQFTQRSQFHVRRALCDKEDSTQSSVLSVPNNRVIPQKQEPKPAQPATPSQRPLADIIAEYMAPSEPLNEILDPSSSVRRNVPPLSLTPPPIRYGPVAGRTIKMDRMKSIDVNRAFGALDRLVKLNKVSSDFFVQRFHERPGLKRKRLKRQRWRKTFKKGFFAMLQRSRELKAMGW